MIYVIGDSHSRSFAKNENFFPLFIGAGKENCFVSDATLDCLKSNITRVVKNLSKNSQILLVLGEPDTRFYLGKGWTPWLSSSQDCLEDIDGKIKASAERYSKLIHWLQESSQHVFYIFNVTPSNRENQNIYVNAFNRRLRDICLSSGVLFVDIEDKLFLDKNKMDVSYMGDEVHLNNLIQPLVEEFLVSSNILQESKFNKDFKFDSKQVQGKFVFNEQFSCYVYESKSSTFKDYMKSLKCLVVTIFNKLSTDSK